MDVEATYRGGESPAVGDRVARLSFVGVVPDADGTVAETGARCRRTKVPRFDCVRVRWDEGNGGWPESVITPAKLVLCGRRADGGTA